MRDECRWPSRVVILQAIMLLAMAAATEAAPASAPQSQPAGAVKRTRAEVEAYIEQMGKTKPEWFDSVELNTPDTLDLTFSNENEIEGWEPQRKLGSYMFSVIGSNPNRYREGAKLMHQVIVVNQKNPARMARAMHMLGYAYYDLLQDYARAVYWWRRADKAAPGKFYNTLNYARAYFKLGSKEMTLQLIGSLGRDNTRHADIARLWAEMGDTQKGLAMTEAVAGDGRPDVGYLAAGDICRSRGEFKRALGYYQKVVETTESTSRDLPYNQERARRNLDGIRIIDALDLTKLKDGTYNGDAIGFKGQLDVEVVILAGRIQSVNVTQTTEDRPLTALSEVPERIVEKQGLKGVDVTAAATVTSDAIINATGKALQQAMK